MECLLKNSKIVYAIKEKKCTKVENSVKKGYGCSTRNYICHSVGLLVSSHEVSLGGRHITFTL